MKLVFDKTQVITLIRNEFVEKEAYVNTDLSKIISKVKINIELTNVVKFKKAFIKKDSEIEISNRLDRVEMTDMYNECIKQIENVILNEIVKYNDNVEDKRQKQLYNFNEVLKDESCVKITGSHTELMKCITSKHTILPFGITSPYYTLNNNNNNNNNGRYNPIDNGEFYEIVTNNKDIIKSIIFYTTSKSNNQDIIYTVNMVVEYDSYYIVLKFDYYVGEWYYGELYCRRNGVVDNIPLVDNICTTYDLSTCEIVKKEFKILNDDFFNYNIFENNKKENFKIASEIEKMISSNYNSRSKKPLCPHYDECNESVKNIDGECIKNCDKVNPIYFNGVPMFGSGELKL